MKKRAWASVLLFSVACVASGTAAEESRTYHSLWGGLFKQQHAASNPAAPPSPPAVTSLHAALAELQSRLLGRLAGGGGEESAAAASPPSSSAGASSSGDSTRRSASGSTYRSALATLDEFLWEQLNATLVLLSRSTSGGGGSGTNSGSNSYSGSSIDSALHLSRLHDALAGPAGSGSGSGSTWSPAEVRELAMQAWALGALAGGSRAAAGSLALHAAASGLGGTGSSSGPSSLSSSLGLDARPAGPLPDPSWAAFRGHTCLRLQNFGNAEGQAAALLGPAPCSPAALGAASASSAALRWGDSASFLFDCSHRSSSSSSASAGSGSGSGGGTSESSRAGADAGVSTPIETLTQRITGSSSSSGGSSFFTGMVKEASKAASKVAGEIAAAWDPRRACHLAISSAISAPAGGSDTPAGSGSAVHLDYAFDRPLLNAPKLDALRLRICNLPPTSLQYPAALAQGPTISLSGLKLNGRPLLPSPVAAPQAAASDGCLTQLYRLSSKATKHGFVLSGWVGLAQGGSGSRAGGSGSAISAGVGVGGGADSTAVPAGTGFGLGEMASLELTLGEYSRLDAAASRLFPGSAAADAEMFAALQPQQQHQQQAQPPGPAVP